MYNRRPVVHLCTAVHYSCALSPHFTMTIYIFSCSTLFMYFFHTAPFPCCIFCIEIFPFSLFMLHFYKFKCFRFAFISCYTLWMLQLFHVALCPQTSKTESFATIINSFDNYCFKALHPRYSRRSWLHLYFFHVALF